MSCAWRDGPCDRTDIHARGLCPNHYQQALGHQSLEEYSRLSGRLTYEQMRDAGLLVCYCPSPAGRPDDECACCRRLILSSARADYLRARHIDQAAG